MVRLSKKESLRRLDIVEEPIVIISITAFLATC